MTPILTDEYYNTSDVPYVLFGIDERGEHGFSAEWKSLQPDAVNIFSDLRFDSIKKDFHLQ